MPLPAGQASMRKFSDAHKGSVTRSGEKLNVPFELVHVQPGWNVRRMNDRLRAHIDWLKTSILEKGIEDDLWGYPLEIKDSKTGEKIIKMVPLNGHNRYQAVSELYEEGHKDILVPFVYKPKMNEEERKALILSSNSGLPLTELEKAEVVRELHSKGWDIAKIAANYAPGEEDFSRFGAGDTMTKIRNKIEWLLTLASADTATKKLVDDGTVAPGNVVAAIASMDNDPDLGSKAIQVTNILAKAEGKTTSQGKISGTQTKEIVEQLKQLDNPEVVLEAVLDAQKAADVSGLPVIEHLPDDLPIGITNNPGKREKQTKAVRKGTTTSLTNKAAYLWNVMETQFEGENAKLIDVVTPKEVPALAEKVLSKKKDDYAFFQLADGKVCILPYEFLNTLAVPGYKGGNLEINLEVVEAENEEEETNGNGKNGKQNLIVVARR